MDTVGITGGTGLVGRQIVTMLRARGHRVVIFTRRLPAHPPSDAMVQYALWDYVSGTCDTNALASISAMIHLAGEPVAARRWTPARKALILNSRVRGTSFLADMLAHHAPHCHTVISASAIGYYGPDVSVSTAFTEEAAPYSDFLASTCLQWETAAASVAEFARLVTIRIGIVLAKEGGALPRLAATLPLHVLPVPGNGRQIVSWIHVQDLARMFIHALDDKKVSGVYNGVAPHPVSFSELVRAVSHTRSGPFWRPHVPAGLIRLAMGEMSIEVLKSCTVSSAAIVNTGFSFRFPSVAGAVKELLSVD